MEPHNFASRPRIEMHSKVKLYFSLRTFQWYVVCSLQTSKSGWFLIFCGQTTNLTPSLAFGHNLCFRCPNEQYKPILDIYIPRDFQWYKECHKQLSFNPWNRFLKFQESIWDSNSHHGSSLGSVKVDSLTLFAFPGACYVTPRFHSWPATLQPFALVASPRLGLRQHR